METTTATRPKTYRELLLMSADEKDNYLVERNVKRAELAIKGAINETESKVEELKARLIELKSQHQLDINQILTTKTELKNYENGLAALKELQTELGL